MAHSPVHRTRLSECAEPLETAEPIRNFADSIIGYAANLIGAALLIFVAWIVASVLRFATLSAMKACKIDEKFAETGKPVSTTIGSTVYWLVFFFFIPAILRALEIRGITEPLEQMFAKVLDFLPNLLLAAAVLVVGLWAAKIVRRAVSGLLFAVRLDEVGEKIGCGKVFGEQKLSALVGLVAYVLVALPVLISSLTALRIETLSNSVSDFFNMILTAAGNIFGAAVLIFAAFIAGSLVSGIITQLLEGFGFDKLLAHVCGEAKSERAKPSVVVGKLSLIAVMFLAVIAACELLHFRELANLLRDFLHFGGNILIGIVVLLVGIYLANLAAGGNPQPWRTLRSTGADRPDCGARLHRCDCVEQYGDRQRHRPHRLRPAPRSCLCGGRPSPSGSADVNSQRRSSKSGTSGSPENSPDHLFKSIPKRRPEIGPPFFCRSYRPSFRSRSPASFR
ncbi:MAG: mechanosensitive ion channel [Lentisphaeria bacterium]|nr:MAG: mechanosensitive ion channel [Lentisphaeria bacterium]